jgi:hypothetical protein
LSTPETALERAAYYRRLRSTGEFTLRQLEEQAKRTEGRNAKRVLAFSFLNPSGKTYTALEALKSSESDSFNNMEKLGQWIGNARKGYPMLTNSHENELYDWLVLGNGVGAGRNQVNDEKTFLDEVYRIIQKRTEFGIFNQNQALNITSSQYLNPVEEQYNEQVTALQKGIAILEAEKKSTIKRFAEAPPELLRRALEPIEAALRRDGQELQRLLLNRNNIMDAAKNQASLFGLRRLRRA